MFESVDIVHKEVRIREFSTNLNQHLSKINNTFKHYEFKGNASNLNNRELTENQNKIRIEKVYRNYSSCTLKSTPQLKQNTYTLELVSFVKKSLILLFYKHKLLNNKFF